MPRNILIDPQRLGSANPNIQFSGSMANTIRLEVLTSGSVQFTGVSGSLLSITDSLSGSLFAISDVSGLPILETFSDDRVVMGRFGTNALVVTGSNVGIGSSSPQYPLDVAPNTATARIGRSLLGTWPVTNTYALFGNSAIDQSTNSGNYAIIQNTDGSTFVNSSTGQLLRFRINNTDALVIDSSRNVGIGTATVSSKLHVYGGDIVLQDAAVNTDSTTLKGYSVANGGFWVINNPANGAGAKLTLGTSFDWDREISILYSPGTVGSAAGILSIGQQDKNNANWTHGVTRFFTNGTERLRIDSSGFVGIGTTTPGNKLDVFLASGDYINAGSAAGSQVGYQITIGGAQRAFFDANGGNGRVRIGTSQGNPYTVALVTAGVSRLTVDSSGFVGIGTALLDSSLVVNGNSVFSGSVLPDGDLTRDLGSLTKRWANVYANSLSTPSVSAQLTGSNLVNGMVLFAGSTGGITGSQSQFFWDNTNSRLGIRTSSPSYPLDVSGDAYLRNLVYVGSGQAIRNVGGAGSVYYMDLGRATFRDGTGANVGGILEASSLYVGTSYWGTALSNGNAAFAGNVGIGTTNTNSNKVAISGGNLSVSGSILPGDNATSYDLGSTIYRWRDLYARTGSFSGDVNITGNLTVLGTQTYVSSTVVDIGDNIITLNSTVNPQRYGGLYINDTTVNTTGSLLWDSDNNYWIAGLKGSEAVVPTGTGTNGLVARWTGTTTLSTGVLYDNGTNVGVGAASDGTKLYVRYDNASSYTPTGFNTSTLHLRNGSGASDSPTMLTFSSAWSGAAWYLGLVEANTTNQGNFVFQARTGASTTAERMRIDTSGNVGINMTPSYTLDVTGISGGNPARFVAASSNAAPALNAETGIILRNTNATVGNYTSITNRDSNNNANAQINLINVDHTGNSAINFVTRVAGVGFGERARFNSAGHFVPGADNTFDLGASGTRWRTLFAANISGSFTPTGATAGSVFFAGASGQIAQDNANFFWDDTNDRLGIGTASPSVKLHVVGASILANNTAIDPDTYSNAVVAGAISETGWVVTSGIGGNAGTGDSWAIGHNGSNLYFGIQNGSAANTMATFMQVSPNRDIGLFNNVGIGTTAPLGGLDLRKLDIQHNGYTTAVVDTLTTATTGSFRYEIARVGIDYNDWNTVGSIEIELLEKYWSQGSRKKYIVWYGYTSNSGSYLTEVSGPESAQNMENYQLVIGSEVSVAGDQRYIPIYVDVQFYTYVTAIIRTNRTLTTANPPPIGMMWINKTPAGVSLTPAFTPSTYVYLNNIGGYNSVFKYGYVGIGSSTPALALDILHSVPQIRVKGTSTTTEVRLNSSWAGTALGAVGTVDAGPFMIYTSNSERVRFDTSGNVGIGSTTTSGVRLHVSDNQSSATARFQLANVNANGGPLRIGYFPDSSGFHITANGNPAHTNVASSTVTRDYTNRAAFEMLNVLGSTLAGSYFDFRYSQSTTFSPVMRLQGDGKVGIGTTTFSSSDTVAVLEVSGSVYIQQNTDNDIKKLQFISNVSNTSLASFESKRLANYGSEFRLQIGRSAGGTGAQNVWKSRIYDDPTAYPNQNTHTTFNMTDTGGSNSNGVDISAVVYIGNGSNAGNTRPSLYATNDAYFATGRGGVGIGTTVTNGNVLAVTGTTAMTGSVLPGIDNLYDLGSASKRWANFYVTNFAPSSITALLTGSNLSNGSVLFANATGGITGSQTQFFWDNTNSRLGIGTSVPSTRLDIVSGTLRASYFAGAYDGELVAGVDAGGYYYGTGFGKNTSIPLYIGSNATIIAMQAGGSERVRIVGSTGNVGIGTNNPAQTLEIQNGTNYHIRLGNSSASTAFTYDIGRSTATGELRFYGNQNNANGYIFDGVNGERLRINTVGNVGIGTSTYTARLFVSGSGTASTPTMIVREGVVSPTGGALAFEVENSDGTTVLAVSGSGNVGIGVSTPSYPLQVQTQAANVNTISLVNGTGNVSRLGWVQNGSTTLAYTSIDGDGRSSGYMNLLTNNVVRITIDSSGNVGIGTSGVADKLAVNGTMSVTGSYLNPGVDNNTSLGASNKRWSSIYGTNIYGNLLPTSMTPGSVLYINSSGAVAQDNSNLFWNDSTKRLGIGTASPATKLAVYGGAVSANYGVFSGSLAAYASPTGALYVYYNTTSNYGTITSVSDNSGNAAPMQLRVGGTLSTHIDASGNVGIGTAVPTAKLTVAGDLYFDQARTIRANSAGEFLLTNPADAAQLTLNTGTTAGYITKINLYGGGATPANTATFTAASAEQMRINSTGVGIGTTSYTARLFVSGSSTASTPTVVVREGVVSPTGGALAFEVEKSNGSTIFAVSGSGFVGIGTSVPNATFEVVGVSGSLFSVTDQLSGSLFSVNTISGLPILEVFSDNTVVAGAYNTNALVVTGSRVGIATNNPDQQLDVRGNIGFGRRAQATVTRYVGLTNTDGNFSSTGGTGTTGIIIDQHSGGDTSIRFKTGTWGVSEDIRMSIDRVGNVGIGTTVATNASYSFSAGGGLNIYNGTQATLRFSAPSSNWDIGSNNNSLYFYDATNTSERMRIDGSGYVYIGGVSTRLASEVVRIGKASTQNSILLNNTAVDNAAIVGVFNDAAALAVNRNTSTGGFVNTGKYAAEFYVVGSSSTSYASVATSAAANTTPTERMRVDASGNLTIGSAVGTAAQSLIHLMTTATGDVPRITFTNATTGHTSGDGSFVGMANNTQLCVWNKESSDILFAANNTERMRIDAAGNVGIGTNNTNSNRVAISGGNLSVSGSVLPGDNATSYDLGSTSYRWRTIFAANISGSLTPTGATAGSVFFAGASGQIAQDNANFFWDDTNNRVGIGTNNPTSSLEIVSSSVGSNANLITIRNSAYNVGESSSLFFSHGTYQAASRISSFLPGSNQTVLTFHTSDTSSVLQQRMVINGSGNVGINTASPGSRLTVGTDFASIAGVTIDTGNAGDSALITRRAASKPAFSILPWDTEVYLTAGVYYDGTTWTHHSNTTNSQLFTMNPSNGVVWYASSDSSASWNVAGGVTLWDTGARWKSSVQSTRAENSYFTGGNVGIGTSTIQAYSGYTVLDIDSTTNGGLLNLKKNGSTVGYINAVSGLQVLAASGNNMYLTVAGANALYIRTNATERMLVDSSGNLTPYLDNTYNLGSSTLRWANVHAVNIISSGSLGPAYSSPSSTSGGTAIYDTVSVSTDGAVYELMIVGCPNAGGSSAYRDIVYGKIIVGTGYNGSAVRNYIQFVAESPPPRALYGSGGGPLTADVVYLQSGTEYTDIAQGGTATIRVKVSGYNSGSGGIYVGNNTTVRLKQLA